LATAEGTRKSGETTKENQKKTMVKLLRSTNIA
jgi:hypothetical protein